MPQYRFFLRYLLAFCIPLLTMGTLLTYYNLHYTKIEEEKNIQAMLQQVQGEFDYMILEMQNAALHIAGNGNIPPRGGLMVEQF